MKRLLSTLVCALGLSTAAFAMGGDMSVGVQMQHGSYANQIGLSGKFQIELVDAFRIEPSFTGFFKNKGLSTWDIDLNMHYLVPVMNKFHVYPLIGVSYSHWSQDMGVNLSYNQDRLGVNVGGGAEFNMTDNVLLTTELRYQLIKDFSQCIVGVGVKYKF